AAGVTFPARNRRQSRIEPTPECPLPEARRRKAANSGGNRRNPRLTARREAADERDEAAEGGGGVAGAMCEVERGGEAGFRGERAVDDAVGLQSPHRGRHQG